MAEGGEDAGFAFGVVGRLGLRGCGEFKGEGLGWVGCAGFVDGGEEAVGQVGAIFIGTNSFPGLGFLWVSSIGL